MQRFAYQVQDWQGQVYTGEFDAADQVTAVWTLQQAGWTVLAVAPSTPVAPLPEPEPLPKAVPTTRMQVPANFSTDHPPLPRWTPPPAGLDLSQETKKSNRPAAGLSGKTSKIEKPPSGGSADTSTSVRSYVPTLQSTREVRRAAAPPAPPPTPSWWKSQRETLEPVLRVFRKYQPIPRTELIVFFDEVSLMLSSGLGLLRALEVASRQQQNDRFDDAVRHLAASLEEGTSLSEAMKSYPRVFSPMEIQTVHAAEESGGLSHVLEKLARYEERQLRLSRQFQAALTYPAFVFVSVILLVVFLSRFLFAQLVVMVLGNGVALPPITQALMGISRVLDQPLVWGVGLALLVVGLQVGSRLIVEEKGRRAWHRLVMGVPVLRDILRKRALAAFCHCLALLYESGVPILRAFGTANAVCDNAVVQDAFQEVLDGVSRGRPMGEALQDSPLFPPLMSSMAAVGETTGELPRCLRVVARVLEQDVELGLQDFISVLEPAMMLVLGLVVAFIVVAAFAPIYGLMSQQLGL